MQVSSGRLVKMVHHLQWNKERNIEEVKQEMREAGYTDEEINYALQVWLQTPQGKNNRS